jgi:hypothetical protein
VRWTIFLKNVKDFIFVAVLNPLGHTVVSDATGLA